jgi:hypothetical protein
VFKPRSRTKNVKNVGAAEIQKKEGPKRKNSRKKKQEFDSDPDPLIICYKKQCFATDEVYSLLKRRPNLIKEMGELSLETLYLSPETRKAIRIVAFEFIKSFNDQKGFSIVFNPFDPDKQEFYRPNI